MLEEDGMVMTQWRDRKYMNKVSLSYDDLPVLEAFDLEIPEDRITAILGPSGCGKTSLLYLLSGLIVPTDGTVDVSGETVGYIFQEDRLLPWLTVYQNICLVKEEENREEIMGILASLELDGFADSYPDELSGGMRQRCAIARGFYFHSTLLLMDEPFKSLDYDLRLSLIAYLGRLWMEKGSTVIFVTHDIDEALLLGHKILVLSRRPTDIAHSYTRKTPLAGRSVSDSEHIELRRKIVGHLADR